jgi:hypothetical protein
MPRLSVHVVPRLEQYASQLEHRLHGSLVRRLDSYFSTASAFGLTELERMSSGAIVERR